MTDVNAAFDLNDDALIADEISDEALEAAACAGPGQAQAFTIAMCTGQEYCPF